MPANCPHCSQEITHLSGFVPQEKLEERIKGVNEAHRKKAALLESQLSELREKATGYDALKAEHTELLAEKTARETRTARTAALEGAGVDPKHLDLFAVMFNADQAGKDEPDDFGAWLGEQAKANESLSTFFGSPPPPGQTPPKQQPASHADAATPGQVSPTEPTPPRTVPIVAALQQDPSAPGVQQFTWDQWNTYYQSPDFQKLPSEEKRKQHAAAERALTHWSQNKEAGKETGRF